MKARGSPYLRINISARLTSFARVMFWILTVDGFGHGLEVHLVLAILHAHHADVLAIEELGIARWATLADSLLEAEAVGGA